MPASDQGIRAGTPGEAPVAEGVHRLLPSNRRQWLLHAGAGFGGLALLDLLARDLAAGPLRSGPSGAALAPWRRPATARSVIFLFMEGGPSHIDTFDPKPELNRLAGKPLPPSFKPVITPMGEGAGAALAIAAEVEAAWPEWHLGVRLASEHRHVCRRACRDPVVLVQRLEPRRGRVPDEHGLDARGSSLARKLGDLWLGH